MKVNWKMDSLTDRYGFDDQLFISEIHDIVHQFHNKVYFNDSRAVFSIGSQRVDNSIALKAVLLRHCRLGQYYKVSNYKKTDNSIIITEKWYVLQCSAMFLALWAERRFRLV